MDRLLESDGSIDGIWRGYSLSSRNLAFYGPGEGLLLFTSHPQVEGFEKLGRQGRGGAALYYGTRNDLPRSGMFQLGARIEDLVVTAARPEFGLTFLLHEDFHAFQAESWGIQKDVRLHVFNTIDPEPFGELLSEESNLLWSAWQASDDARRRLLFDYLSLRAARESKMSKEQIAAERHFEIIEGTATFFDIRASQALGLRSADRIRAIRSGLFFDNERPLQWHMRERSYGVGLLLCLMLQSLSSSNDWQAKIAGSEVSLSEAIAEELGFSAKELRERGDTLLLEAGRLKVEIAGHPAVSIRKLGLNLSDYPYYLFFALPNEQKAVSLDSRGSVSFTKGGIYHLDQDWNMVTFPERFSYLFDGGDLQVYGHPVISKVTSSEKSTVSEFIVLLKSEPGLLDRRGALFAEDTIQGQHRWQGIHLRSDRPITFGFGLISEPESHLPAGVLQ
ncbi:MAG: hypothetical protein ACLFSC_00775 [Wenzhouxiangella sp.]